MKLTKQK